jgi:hypothetical protein
MGVDNIFLSRLQQWTLIILSPTSFDDPPPSLHAISLMAASHVLSL